MQNSKITRDESKSLQTNLNEFDARVRQFNMRDNEIMEKFCTPTGYPLCVSSARSADTAAIEIPNLVSKLIEVEYMM
jgi:hypothetical protein